MVSFYSELFRFRHLRYKILRNQTCDIKFPIFLNKIVLFKLRGRIARKHKKGINSSITVFSYISNVKLSMTFPMNYRVIKIN